MPELDQNTEIETSLLILPEGFDDFEVFLDLLAIADEILIVKATKVRTSSLAFTQIISLVAIHSKIRQIIPIERLTQPCICYVNQASNEYYDTTHLPSKFQNAM